MKKITLGGFLMITLLLMSSLSFAQNQNTTKSDEVSMGLDPNYMFVNTPACVANTKFPTDVAYAYSVSTTTKGPVSFTLNNPGSLSLIADQTAMDWIAGSSYANGVWYGATYTQSAGSSLVTLDPITGTRNILGTMGGKSVSGLAFDWTTNIMYAITWESPSAKLYTVNLTNGALTSVGTVGAFLGICLGCSASGVLYTVALGTDELMQIDKSNASSTVVGPIGFNANYAQDMEYDNSDGTMYYAAYNADASPGNGELRTVNLVDGSTTLIGAFQSNAEIAGFCILNTTVGIDKPSIDNSISIYPNPATCQLNVSAEGNQITKVTMLNNLGQTVFASTLADKTITINTSDMVKGIYFVVVETAKGKTTHKVAVE